MVADSTEPASVEAMVAATRVLLHAAGPYAEHGEACFCACIEHGTDYVDIGGETFFLRRMIRTHHAAARQRGPSDAAMEQMDYRLDVFAASEAGDRVSGRLTGRGHPGYRSTATMAAEAALALALDREHLPPCAGIVTPAAGLGLFVRERLKTAGIELTME
ncbi:MAG: saccharopine dehydrogenase NADP-binding domain-containing protein [Myxococcota bacterium]|nr:saccharopine dehydrogenase NADP-binding domain-containing protein [Myxococcota bacterium]